MKYILLFLILPLTTTAQGQLVGTLKSFSYAYESYLKTDGEGAQNWCEAIGSMIITHPTNFLKSYLTYENKVGRLDSILGGLGPKYVDDFARQKEELIKRKLSLERAMKRLERPELKRVANICISMLSEKIKSLE